MTPDQAPEFLVRLTAVGDLFNAKMSEATQVLYFDALKDLSLESVSSALAVSVKKCKFMPKPVEIRECIEGDDETITEAAWLEYKRLARAVGSYGSPEVSDGALGRTILAVFGSWEGACIFEASPEMWASKRKEFGRVYKTLRVRGDGAPLRLAGFCERDNRERGFETITRRITDAEIAGLLTEGASDE